MSEQRARPVKVHLRRFLTKTARTARAFREWYRELLEESGSEARGLRLLREWLSPEQRAQFDAGKYFDVIGSDSGKKYRIRLGTAMNIHELDDDGRSVLGWCFVPLSPLVAGDVVLAQKIAQETNERGALAVAKSFKVRDVLVNMRVPR
jgi:hypothetical protein